MKEASVPRGSNMVIKTKGPCLKFNPGHLSHSPSLYSIQISYPGSQVKMVGLFKIVLLKEFQDFKA
jgi:hypothetical protein